MNFEEAIHAVKNGKRVARANWNGKNMFIYLKKGSYAASETPQSYIEGIRSSLFERGAEKTVTRLPTICMKTANGSILEGWLASQTDMLAMDWEGIN